MPITFVPDPLRFLADHGYQPLNAAARKLVLTCPHCLSLSRHGFHADDCPEREVEPCVVVDRRG